MQRRLFSTKFKPVPSHIPRPPYVLNPVGNAPQGSTHPHTQHSIFKDYKSNPSNLISMRRACIVARDALAFSGSLVQPGTTTEQIDQACHDFICDLDVYPAPLGYMGFPKSVCASVNQVMCHGIPDERVIKPGDLVSLDISTFLEGHHGDNCGTFIAGDAAQPVQDLVTHTAELLDLCIAACGPGKDIAEIGQICSSFSAAHGYTPSSAFCGHGIADTFHMKPLIIHAANYMHEEMVPGQVFTIEPILVMGPSDEHITWESDGWTAASKFNYLSAQKEHTILITEDGVEVLTGVGAEEYL